MIPIASPINQLQWPTNWDEEYSRAGPLHVEVGFGNGQFLVHLAQAAPEVNFIGLEISLPSLRNGERKVVHSKIDNVRLIRSSAQSALWLLFRPATISRIYINFPDPWPKASHQGRRLVSDSFLNLAANRMIFGSKLEIATDHSDYAAWIAEHLSRSPYFSNDGQLPAYTTEDNERTPTKYELKAIAAGHVCHYFKWVRNTFPSPDIYAIPEEDSMPHIVLHSSLSVDEIAKSFEQKEFSEGTTKVRFIALYQSGRSDIAVIDTFIHEEPLEQRVLLSVAKRQTGDFLISLHEVGFPRPTNGIHLAVYWLGKWVQGISDEAKIVRHNLKLLD